MFVIYQTVVIAFVTSIAPAATNQPTTPPPLVNPDVSLGASEPNLFMAILSAVIVLAVIALSAYIFIKAPSFVAKSNKKVVQSAANVSTTIALRVQQKPDTPKRRKKLTSALVISIKCLVVVVPLVLSLMAGAWSDGTLDPGVAMALGAGLAACSALLFGMQYGLAALFHVKRQDIS